MSSVLGSLTKQRHQLLWLKPGHGLLRDCSLELVWARLCRLPSSILYYFPKRCPSSSSPSEKSPRSCSSRSHMQQHLVLKAAQHWPWHIISGSQSQKKKKGKHVLRRTLKETTAKGYTLYIWPACCRERASLYSIGMPALLGHGARTGLNAATDVVFK